MAYQIKDMPFSFRPKIHITAESSRVRLDWPFHIMPIHSSLETSSRFMYDRAVAASRYYERTRGFEFKHCTTLDGSFLIYRVK